MSGDRDNWNFTLGRWGTVRVGLHLFLVLAILFCGFLAWDAGKDDGTSYLGWFCLSIGVFATSLIVHQLAHILAARRLGGDTDAIVLGPLGDMRPIRIHDDPQSEFVAILSGPMTSLFVSLVCVAGISAVSADTSRGLLHPLGTKSLFFAPDDTPLPTITIAFHLACWVNWWLASANLLPAFPFDGGRALVCLLAMARPTWDRSRLLALVGILSRLTALLLLVVAVAIHGLGSESLIPGWFALTLIAVLILFSARREEAWRDRMDREADPFGYDFSEGYTSLDRSAVPPVRPSLIGWLVGEIRRRHRERSIERQVRQETMLDEVLQKLHEQGNESLTYAERSLLFRASVRYRRESRSENP